MEQSAAPDIFVSYARTDESRVDLLCAALGGAGCAVWRDEEQIEKFSSIRSRIEGGLSRAKVLLACYSHSYLRRPWCMAELAAAYLAAIRVQECEKRVLVLNLESSVDHIYPTSLRDQLLPRLPEVPKPDELMAISEAVVSRLSQVSTPLASIGVAATPQWYGSTRLSSPRFVGRVRELWSIHDALVWPDRPFAGGERSRGVCQVRGLGGVGKSLIAEEYAWRFAPAWPGGVYWLNAGGDRVRSHEKELEPVEATVRSALANLVADLGADPEGMKLHELRSFIATHAAKQGLPALWVVDDLPHGLNDSAFRKWLPPHALFRTLITTRSRAYEGRGGSVDLDVLDPDDAIGLLIQGQPSDDAQPPPWAAALAERLGFHALAIDVARAALLQFRGMTTPEEFLADLEDPESDVLELAAELAGELPNGHEPSIASTLLKGLEHLPDTSLTLLRIAAVAADAGLPLDWLAKVSANILQLADSAAKVQVLGAVKALQDRAFGSRDQRGALLVHSLVSRSIRYRDRAAPELAATRLAARSSLAGELEDATDARRSLSLAPLVPHARALAEPYDAVGIGLLQGIGDFEFALRSYKGATRTFSTAHSAARALWGEQDMRTGSALNRFGLAAAEAGRLAEALDAFITYERIAAAAGPSHHSDVILSRGNQASVLNKMGRTREATAIEQEILSWRHEHLGADHPLTLVSMHQLAIYLAAVGKGHEAIGLEREAWSRRKRVLGEDHFHTLSSLQHLAVLEVMYGNVGAARRYAEENARLRLNAAGPEHPGTKSALRVLINVGCASHKRLEVFGTSIEALLRSATTWHDENNVGLLLWRMARFREALALFDKLLASKLASPSDRLLVMHNRLATLVDMGSCAEAETQFTELHAQEIEMLGHDAPLTLCSRFFRALNFESSGQTQATLTQLGSVHHDMSAVLPETHFYLLRCRRELALRKATGDRGCAAPALAEAREVHQLFINTSGADDPETSVAGGVAGVLELLAGSCQEACHALAKVVSDLSDAWEPRHPEATFFAWYLCQAERRTETPGWQARFQELVWLKETAPDALGRVLRLTLNDIHHAGWAPLWNK